MNTPGSVCIVMDFTTDVERESKRLHDVISTADLERPVPSCPGWTLADLTWHIAEVQEFWAQIAGRLLESPDDVDRVERPADQELADLLRTQSTNLVDALRARRPDDACWSWFDEGRTVGWVARRQAHEALIHRVDAELGAGIDIADIGPELAADGIDELLTIFLDASDIPDWSQFTADGRSCLIDTTDTGDRWQVSLGRFHGTSPTLSLIHI